MQHLFTKNNTKIMKIWSQSYSETVDCDVSVTRCRSKRSWIVTSATEVMSYLAFVCFSVFPCICSNFT